MKFKYFNITVLQVFLNLTKDFAKDEQTDAELSQEGPSFTVDNDGLSMNSNNLFEPDGIKIV